MRKPGKEGREWAPARRVGGRAAVQSAGPPGSAWPLFILSPCVSEGAGGVMASYGLEERGCLNSLDYRLFFSEFPPGGEGWAGKAPLGGRRRLLRLREGGGRGCCCRVSRGGASRRRQPGLVRLPVSRRGLRPARKPRTFPSLPPLGECLVLGAAERREGGREGWRLPSRAASASSRCGGGSCGASMLPTCFTSFKKLV